MSSSTARVILGLGSLRVEEPVHTSWSRFCIVNPGEPASNWTSIANSSWTFIALNLPMQEVAKA